MRSAPVAAAGTLRLIDSDVSRLGLLLLVVGLLLGLSLITAGCGPPS